MFVKHADDVAEEKVAAGEATTRQVLISSEEGPHFALRRFIMQPGGGMPRHTNTVEHEQYVLRGHARIGLGDETIEVKADDVVYIPAGMPHWYEALGSEPFEFLCIVPNLPDKIEVLKGDAAKVGAGKGAAGC
jgi:quercetin dioxygenase-like cupin family protein